MTMAGSDHTLRSTNKTQPVAMENKDQQPDHNNPVHCRRQRARKKPMTVQLESTLVPEQRQTQPEEDEFVDFNAQVKNNPLMCSACGNSASHPQFCINQSSCNSQTQNQ